jgi:hypothetical protein
MFFCEHSRRARAARVEESTTFEFAHSHFAHQSSAGSPHAAHSLVAFEQLRGRAQLIKLCLHWLREETQKQLSTKRTLQKDKNSLQK